ncbi:hypothetical protein [Pseudarthrobacter chlorophenolicus]|nr:hypothetical protein [Pseudarthrobacter chlorophenolicus]
MMKARALLKSRKEICVPDWQELCLGESVSILKNAQVIAMGRVKEVSKSGRVLWITTPSQVTEEFIMSDDVTVKISGRA